MRDIGVPSSPSPDMTAYMKATSTPRYTPTILLLDSILSHFSFFLSVLKPCNPGLDSNRGSHPNKPDWRLAVVGRDTGYGYLYLITCYPATSHTAPVVSLYLLPDKLLGNRQLLYLPHLLVEKTFLATKAAQ